MWRSIRSVGATFTPENSRWLDSKRFPAALPLMMGWLSHERTCSRGQMLITVMSVPLGVISTSQGLEHSWHVLKSSLRQLSNTRNWRSSSGGGGVELDAPCSPLEWDHGRIIHYFYTKLIVKNECV